jgi:hypothetical protein
LEVTRILAEIDAQIAKLQQARVLLSGAGTTSASSAAPAKKAVGRPRKSVEAPSKPAPASGLRKKRNLSPEARKRIADAQKRRWAERKKVV